jgi:HNH endonuclease
LYTESWDEIRHKVYERDGHRCVICGKKGKLHAHHIVPVKLSHDNSMTNLVTLCGKHHLKLEKIGFAILERGGGRTDVRRAELQIIMEARKERFQKLIENRDKIESKEKTFERPNTNEGDASNHKDVEGDVGKD